MTTITQINPLCSELVLQLRKIGKLESDPHKRASYMKAADVILDNIDNFRQLVVTDSFKTLPGIGDSINKKIKEFFLFGYIPKLKDMEQNEVTNI